MKKNVYVLMSMILMSSCVSAKMRSDYELIRYQQDGKDMVLLSAQDTRSIKDKLGKNMSSIAGKSEEKKLKYGPIKQKRGPKNKARFTLSNGSDYSVIITNAEATETPESIVTMLKTENKKLKTPESVVYEWVAVDELFPIGQGVRNFVEIQRQEGSKVTRVQVPLEEQFVKALRNDFKQARGFLQNVEDEYNTTAGLDYPY